MAGTCSMHGSCIQNVVRKAKVNRPLANVCVDRRTIPKWILRKRDVMA
jgi:hypothetical protein